MKLSKSAKIVVGIITFLPFFLLACSFVFAAYQIISMFLADDPMMPLLFLSYLGYVIPYLFALAVVYLGLGIFYLVHIIQNHSLDSEKRILWIIVIVAFHGVSMPFYWYVHLWRKETKANTKQSFEQTYESRA